MLGKPECLRAFYEELDTIDAVMVAAEYGHGKRAVAAALGLRFDLGISRRSSRFWDLRYRFRCRCGGHRVSDPGEDRQDQSHADECGDPDGDLPPIDKEERVEDDADDAPSENCPAYEPVVCHVMYAGQSREYKELCRPSLWRKE